MTTIRLSRDVELTTDSPMSHYGVPALRIAGVDYMDFGPGDTLPGWEDVKRRTGDDSLPNSVRSFRGLPAAMLVINLAHSVGDPGDPDSYDLPALTTEGRASIGAYLRQMPDLRLTDAQARLLDRAGINV